MNRLLLLALFVITGAQQSWAQEVVYSSAHLAKRNGAYYPTGATHLYRVAIDGKAKGQLTNADFDDTDPCLSSDKQHILFLRRDRMDRLGKTWLCSIRPDGTGLVALWRFAGEEVKTPLEIRDQARSNPLPRVDLGGWRETGDGDNGFEDADEWRLEWLDTAKTTQLYESSAKTPDGCWPVIYQIDAAKQKCTARMRGFALEDVDPKRAVCLVSRWWWGARRRFDGACPLGRLAIWNPKSGLTFVPQPQGTIRGACFCPPSPPAKPAPPAKRSPNPSGGPIIFSAARYADRMLVPFEIDRPHLYSMRRDGSGVKQLTFGDQSEVQPSLSNDGRHILFWRTRSDPHGLGKPYDLYRMAVDGSHVESLGLRWRIEKRDDRWRPEAFEANAFEVFGHRTAHAAYINDEDRILIRTARGKKSIEGDHYAFAPDGRHILVASYGQSQNYVVDLRTGATRKLASAFIQPVWLDRKTLVARKAGDTISKVVIIGLNGKLKFRFSLKQASEDVHDLLEQAVRGFHLGNGRNFLWEFHHDMSDGGFDFSFLVHPKARTIDGEGETIEAVSPSGVAYLNSESAWYGGYKRHGAEKLCTLSITDVGEGDAKPVAFRRMICFGACWVRR